MARSRSNWTEYETARAREFIAAGMKAAEFKSRTGRSKATAVAHIRYQDDPAYRQKCIDNTERYRKTYVRRVPSDLPAIYGRSGRESVIPPSVIEEANRRLSAPKSLTGWICGDPFFSQSALGKKLGAFA